MYDPTVGRWTSTDPIGFSAGDENLYRYVHNAATNATDPSGLSGWLHHPYPLHLGGSRLQPVIRIASEAAHQAIHNFLSAQGFPPGHAGRLAWASLTLRQQEAYVIRALRVGGVPNTVIRANIGRIMYGATPGVRTIRPSGFPGGRIVFGIGAMAIAQILLDPSIVRAEETQRRTWRHLPPETVGHVEMTQLFASIDRPRFWNIFPDHDQRVVDAGIHSEWMDLGQMTVAEARQLEGLDESRLYDGFLFPPPSGYYRTVEVWTIVRFNGQR